MKLTHVSLFSLFYLKTVVANAQTQDGNSTLTDFDYIVVGGGNACVDILEFVAQGQGLTFMILLVAWQLLVV